MLFDKEFILSLGIFLKNFSFLLSFIAPIIAGENGVLAIAFLSAQGFFPIWIPILFCFLGMLAIDSIWYFIAKSKFAIRIKARYKNLKSLEKHVEKISGGKDILLLLISKVLIGTRILIIIYLGGRKISYRRFMYYNFLPTLIWSIILNLLGWFAGKGYNSITIIFKDFQIGITFLIGFFIILYISMKGINKWLMKRQKKLI